jgi:ABC-type dipeptide/oligopeptide/nickel transport system permease component
VIQAVVLIYTTLFIAVNLMVDLSYGFFNPRIRY